jgi:hypothetical protein
VTIPKNLAGSCRAFAKAWTTPLAGEVDELPDARAHGALGVGAETEQGRNTILPQGRRRPRYPRFPTTIKRYHPPSSAALAHASERIFMRHHYL